MNWLKRKRFKQILQFGWKDAKEISVESGKSRFAILYDIFKCFKKYYIFSNQYKSNKVWTLNNEERIHLANTLGSKNRYRDEWTVWKYENAAFINKYSQIKYGTSPEKYRDRLVAYMKRYNIGEGCSISNNVVIERNHYLEGSIQVGKNVLISKNVYIDYSGELIIHDKVGISAGVTIETHSHSTFTSINTEDTKREKLVICDHVNLGTKSIITESCHRIGRYAKIGAGAVVRNNIPPYAIVIGNPAKVINFIFTPKEMAEFERQNYPEEERTSLDLYTRQYNKLYLDNLDTILNYNKLKV